MNRYDHPVATVRLTLLLLAATALAPAPTRAQSPAGDFVPGSPTRCFRTRRRATGPCGGGRTTAGASDSQRPVND